MDQLYTFKNYIYESPDGGRTVYQRLVGSTQRTIVQQNRTARFDPMDALRFEISYSEFCEIMQQAEINPTVKQCLDQLVATYNLVKTHE